MSTTPIAMLPPADAKARIMGLAKSQEMAVHPTLKARLSVMHASLCCGTLTSAQANKEIDSIFQAFRNIKSGSLSGKEFYKNVFADTVHAIQATKNDNLRDAGRPRPLPLRIDGKLFELIWQFDNGWLGLLKERLCDAFETYNGVHAKKITLKAEDLNMMGQWVADWHMPSYPRSYFNDYALEGADGLSYYLVCKRAGKRSSDQFNFTFYRFISEPSANVVAVETFGAKQLNDALCLEDSTSIRFAADAPANPLAIRRAAKETLSDHRLPLNTESLTHFRENKHGPNPVQIHDTPEPLPASLFEKSQA